MRYLYEMHMHTSQVSRCGEVSAAESARMYKQKGYSGIVITDHMHPDVFESVKDASWDEKVDFFKKGYNLAVETAQDESFDVILGMELRFVNESNNDYLIYGFTEEQLRAVPEPYNLTLKEYRKIADENDLLIYQAHPFRNHMKIVKPELLDGIEVHNGHTGHESRNSIAEAWAELYGLAESSGSDFHRPEHLARGGMLFYDRAKNQQDIKTLLRSGSFGIFRGGY